MWVLKSIQLVGGENHSRAFFPLYDYLSTVRPETFLEAKNALYDNHLWSLTVSIVLFLNKKSIHFFAIFAVHTSHNLLDLWGQ